jgi:hypothetical protein
VCLRLCLVAYVDALCESFSSLFKAVMGES